MDEAWSKLRGTPNWPAVKRIQLPIKKVLDILSAKGNYIPIPDTEGFEITSVQQIYAKLKFRHLEDCFYALCSCEHCIEYRETILQLMDYHLKSMNMWDVLKTLMRNYYQPIIRKAPAVVAKVYEALFNDEKCWQTNGVVNLTKLQHLEFVSDLCLTDNMIFVLYSTLLLVDDAHQLFELMTYQVECFARAYAEGITEKLLLTSEAGFLALNYVLEGYNDLCTIAKKMGSFLFAFENNHLEQFSLSWVILNKRMYQKWVHSTISATAPQIILKLKSSIPTDRYIEFVKRYETFDSEMMIINTKWKDVWIALNKYHMSPEDQDRRQRICALNDLFQAIRQDLYVPFHQFVDISDWETYSDRYFVWQNMVAYIKKSWPVVDKKRLTAALNGEESMDNHKIWCKCVTCLIAGGLILPHSSNSIECTIVKQIDPIYSTSSFLIKTLESTTSETLNIEKAVTSTDTVSNYHVSWAVFKHLKDRKQYTNQTLDLSFFCQNCNREDCIIAKKIINNEVMIGLANILLIYYRPFDLTLEELEEMVPNVMCWYRKVFAMDLLLTVEIDDIVVKTFWTFYHSILARYIIDVKTDSSHMSLVNFEISNDDIELKTDFINNSQPNTLLDYFFKFKLLITPENQSISDDENRGVTSKTLVEAVSCKEESVKSNNYCCDILGHPEHCKKIHLSKICFHEKECGHLRIHETRDRLRKKLKTQTLNIKKSFDEITKNSKKHSSCLRNEIMSNHPNLENETSSKTEQLSIGNEYVEESELKENNLVYEENQNKNLDTWIKETLSFVEGCEKVKCANKKSAKKARQKLKKEESKRIVELCELKLQYNDLYFKEFTSKIELKQHKSAKKRDRKKITKLENNIKKLNVAKSRIESSILELLSLIKSINSDFKFSYLPTREQQQECLKKYSNQNVPTIQKIKAISQAIVQNPLASNKLILNQRNIIPFTKTTTPPKQQPIDCATDPSKRIVTIRRINIPHVSEPQVTVTAKGTSPDKDKLLYTFINGQLVPATSLDSQTSNILLPVVPKLKQLSKSFEGGDQNKGVQNLPEFVVKTKTQLKKERKTEKKLAVRNQHNKKLIDNKLLSMSSTNKFRNSSDKQDSREKIQCIKNKIKPIKENTLKSNEIVTVKSKQVIYTQQINKITKQFPIEQNFQIAENVGDGEDQSKQINHSSNNDMLDERQFKWLHLIEPLSAEKSGVSERNSKSEDRTISKPRHIKFESSEFMNTDKLIRPKQNINKKAVRFLSGSIVNIDNLTNVNQSENENIKKKKKLGNENCHRFSIEETVINAENMAKSLYNSMQKLNLNADTTIEIAKDNPEKQSNTLNLNVSIMEQINKGVQVEELHLPPGITLTKVNPLQAETLRVKRESIGKLSQPLKNELLNSQSPAVISQATLPHLKSFDPQNNGIIMVDTLNHKPIVESTVNNFKQSKQKRRKIKKTFETESDHKKCRGTNMITLRNPMFHGENLNDIPVQVSSSCLQVTTVPNDQPAAIIKNDNGMFTIRNPALHKAFANGLQNSFPQYNPYYYLSNNDSGENLSYFTEGNTSNSNSISSNLIGGKSIPAIGSEIKCAQLHKTPSHHNSFRHDFIQQKYQQSNYYNGKDVIHGYERPSSSCETLFDKKLHSCDDSPPPSGADFNHYLYGIPQNSNINNKYDDLSFFRNLIPGQRLNSEVTIHNINDSKYSNNKSSVISQGVEITPISSFISRNSQDMASTRERIGEYGDNLFAPNQTLNLSELESDERDIESFKRFSYGFEPPKNKPKVNINVDDLLANNRKLQNAVSSSSIVETMIHDMKSLKLSTENINGNSYLSEEQI